MLGALRRYISAGILGVLALWALPPMAAAACVFSDRVPVWLTTELEGVPGLGGFRYRVQEREFLCRNHPEGPLKPIKRWLAVYQGLPGGLAIVEYPTGDAELTLSPPLEGGRKTGRLEVQTLVYVYRDDPRVLEVLDRLLGSGEVEFLFVKYGLDLPKRIFEGPAPPVVLLINPGTFPEVFQLGRGLLDLAHLSWAYLEFLYAESGD